MAVKIAQRTVISVEEQQIVIQGGYKRAKLCLDLAFTLLVLIPLCLITIIIALLIRLDSTGPIFYRQKRIGQGGKEFCMYKFRSMYVNNDDALHREAIAKYMQGQQLSNGKQDCTFKRIDDPRITRVGRILRKTSLDELPQFFNVLRGEMSLVGPRPSLPYEFEMYGEHDKLRLCGKPGLTGTWQVYGRSRVTFQQMVEMDVAYLRQQSLLADLKLIVLTVPVMASGRGGA